MTGVRNASIITAMERIIVLKNDAQAAGHPGQADIDDPATVYESPARMSAALSAVHFFSQLRGLPVPVMDAPPATREQLLLAHTAEYLAGLDSAIAKAALTDEVVDLGNEAFVSASSKAAILTAAGAGIAGVDKVQNGQANHVFCIVRPPGHHAERLTPMGFCSVSNAAIAAMYAASHFGVDVAVFDFDAHRGNGTEDVVANQPGILFCDMFIDGEGEFPYQESHPISSHAPTNVVRVPLVPSTTGAEYVAQFRSKVLTRVAEFNPKLLIFSAGFDCLDNDPVGGFSLTPKHLHSVVRNLLSICDRSVSMLEGGYHINHLGLGVLGHLMALEGKSAIDESAPE